MPPLAPLLPKRSTILTALDQPHTRYYSSTFLRFYKFTENNKLPINSPIEAYHKPITYHHPFSPNALHSPHSNFNALHNPTFMPPLAPLLPKRSTILTALDQPHTRYYSSTFLRFYKFTENNKLPINSPIEAYHKPITYHHPFSPNALHSPHSNFDALHNPTFMPPLAPLLPKRSTILTALDQPHPLLQFHIFTILQIHRK